MGFASLLKNNLRYYWRNNLAVVVGVATAVAVLAGALLVGDSVRASLRDLFLQRLGRTAYVVTATRYFREQLAGDLQNQPQFAGEGFESACPLLALDGSVSEASGARAGSVLVYGVDERFWKFHGREGKQAPQNREVFVSESLAHELNSKVGDSVLLRIEKPSDVPRESLYGRKEDVGRTLRLTIKEVLSGQDLGEFSIRPQQGAVRAVFVPLSLLQRELEQPGQVNTILVSEKTTANAAALQKIMKSAASLDDYDVKLRVLKDEQSISLERTSTLVDDALADTAVKAASGSQIGVTRIFSYVVNGIHLRERSIPYSLVTALDDPGFARLFEQATLPNQPDANAKLPLHRIILNEWAARDLGAVVGDQVALDYFVWEYDGHLVTAGPPPFQVVAILPITGLAADRNLVPDYPGIGESESMADWDPPFPVELSRIRQKDEDYWKQYRTTPKAFIPLAEGQALWQSRFGKLTSLRLTPSSSAPFEQSVEVFRRQLTESLDPAAMGYGQFLCANKGWTPRAARPILANTFSTSVSSSWFQRCC